MATTQRKRRPEAMDILVYGAEVKDLTDAGTFTGHAAVFKNRDQLRDVVEPGAFAETLEVWAGRGALPRVRWRHGFPIGHTTEAKEDAAGLAVAGQLWLDDPDVRELYADIRAGVAAGRVGMSFAFRAQRSERKGDTRHLHAVTLEDDITISPRPVNPAARLNELKSDGGAVLPALDVSAAEAVRRDAGLSAREAKAVLAGGYGALRDAATQRRAALASIRDALRNI